MLTISISAAAATPSFSWSAHSVSLSGCCWPMDLKYAWGFYYSCLTFVYYARVVFVVTNHLYACRLAGVVTSVSTMWRL